MIRPRQKGLFLTAIVCALAYALMFSATTVFAEEPAPPEVNTEETTEPPADESQGEPVAEIEEQTDASDAETDLLAEPQDETVAQAEEPGVVEALPTENEEGTAPEQEPTETPAPSSDAGSEFVEKPALAASEAESVLEQLPADTAVVVVVDEQVEPLATQAAAQAVANADPIWCPDGVAPGGTGCTASYLTMEDLLTNEAAYIDA